MARQFKCRKTSHTDLNYQRFIGLHIEKPNHAGIIACDPDFEAQAVRIHANIENQPMMSGQLIRVNRPSE